MENFCEKCGKSLNKDIEKCPKCGGKSFYYDKQKNNILAITIVTLGSILLICVISAVIMLDKGTKAIVDVSKDILEYVDDTTCSKKDIDTNIMFIQNIEPIIKRLNIDYINYNYNCTQACTINSGVIFDEVVENCYNHYYEIKINNQTTINLILKEQDKIYNTEQINYFLEKYYLANNLLHKLNYNKEIIYTFNVGIYINYGSDKNEYTREEIDEYIEIIINENLEDILSNSLIENIKYINNEINKNNDNIMSLKITFKDKYIFDLYLTGFNFTDKYEETHYYSSETTEELLTKINNIKVKCSFASFVYLTSVKT